MNDQQSSGLSARVRAALHGTRDLLRNAGSLAATTGLTSVLGFGFWWVAAREFTKAEIGYGSAATNAMALLGTIGMFGLGTMLIGELPRRRERGGLFSASLVTSAVGSLILGLVFAVIAEAVHARVPEMDGSPFRLVIFVAGVTLTGATLVFDEGTIGLMRGGVQLWRNLAMSVLKLAVLPITAILLHDEFGVGITLSFVIGTAVSMVPAVIMLLRSGSKIWHRPDWPELRRLFKVALNHNWLNLAIVAPGRIIPVIVTLVVSPDANGVFYIAWMIVSFLFMVPVHLSTVLFAIASASPELIAEKLRFVLRVSLLIGLPVMAILAISAHFALSLFGPGYAPMGTVPLWLLVIGYIPQMPKAQFIAVSRATNKVGRAAALLCATSTCEIIAITIGGKLGGLDGLSFAYLGVLICEGLITAPTVLRAAYARTAAGTGAFPAMPATARTTRAPRAQRGPPGAPAPGARAARPGHRRARQADRLADHAARRARPAGDRPRRAPRARLGRGLRRAHARRGDRGLADRVVPRSAVRRHRPAAGAERGNIPPPARRAGRPPPAAVGRRGGPPGAAL